MIIIFHFIHVILFWTRYLFFLVLLIIFAIDFVFTSINNSFFSFQFLFIFPLFPFMFSFLHDQGVFYSLIFFFTVSHLTACCLHLFPLHIYHSIFLPRIFSPTSSLFFSDLCISTSSPPYLNLSSFLLYLCDQRLLIAAFLDCVLWRVLYATAGLRICW